MEANELTWAATQERAAFGGFWGQLESLGRLEKSKLTKSDDCS